MYIKGITIKNYRAFQQPTKVPLKKGVNIITGLNGIGKSTILALLTNATEFNTNDAPVRPYLRNAFRGQFQDVIEYDSITDDITGLTPDKKPTAEIKFSEKINFLSGNPSNIVKYTASVSQSKLKKKKYLKLKSNNTNEIPVPENLPLYEQKEVVKEVPRFRFLSNWAKESGKKSRGKIKWPTLYLGLSRVFPNGENNESSSKPLSEDKYTRQMLVDHINILSEHLENDNVSADTVTGDNSPKIGTGLSTPEYGPLSNSSGQDNLSQILLAIQSFARLKDSMGEQYSGGLLAIDEIDATLHPAAQNKLIDYLVAKSQELDLQIVVTTHSLSLIDQFEKQITDTGSNLLIELDRDSEIGSNKIEVIENPPISRYKNVLSRTMGQLLPKSPLIKVLTEDEVARYFIKKIIEQFSSSSKYQMVRELDFLETSIGYSSLLILLDSDHDYYSNMITILDADVKKENIIQFAPNLLSDMKFNDSKGVIFSIPGSNSFEQTMFDYIISENTKKLWTNQNLRDNNITKELILEDYKKNNLYYKIRDNGDRKFIVKKWYLEKQELVDIALNYYFKDNRETFEEWINKLNSAIKRLSLNQQK